MESDPLDRLVVRAKEGETSAFEEIVRRFSRRAVATAHFLCGDLQAGEEAAQDAFVAAWRRIGELREVSAFPGWFGTILSRTATRARPRPHRPLPPGQEPLAREEPPDGGLPSLARALKPKYREVLALRYVEGLSYKEISVALGIPVARVKSRLHDGRELLRERILRKKGER